MDKKTLNKEYLEKSINTIDKHMIVLWFSAPWCVPCKNIKELCETRIEEFKNLKIEIHRINIDDNLDVFGMLKTKRVVKGVPSILAYYCDKKRDIWYTPDDSVLSGKDMLINEFFDRCIKKAQDYK